VYPQTIVLNKIQFITSIKTTTYFDTGVPSSGSYRTEESCK